MGMCPPQMLKTFANLTLNGAIWQAIVGKKNHEKVWAASNMISLLSLVMCFTYQLTTKSIVSASYFRGVSEGDVRI